jgi:hypothetical protein
VTAFVGACLRASIANWRFDIRLEMSRLIATQVAVKDLQEVQETKTESSESEKVVTVDPKASLNFRGLSIKLNLDLGIRNDKKMKSFKVK